MHTINETIEQLLSYLKWQKRLGIKEIYLSEDIKNMLSFSKKNELLEIVKEELKDCRRCKLYKERNHIVFGEGNEDARLMLIGEAPGHEEDLQGRPFVGAAGHLLDNMLKAINLSRKEVYIANIVKCRPPHNRKPERDEIEACKPFLLKQIDIIKPSIICTLGSTATQTLLETKMPITKLRGHIYDFSGIKLIPTFHPAYLLRNPYQKKGAWEDLKLIEKIYKGLF